jgi:hypothetical protein
VTTGAGCTSVVGTAGWATGTTIGCWIAHGWTSFVGCWTAVVCWASPVVTDWGAVTGTEAATGVATPGWAGATGAGWTTGVVWVGVTVLFDGTVVELFAISFWSACLINSSCNDGSLLILNERINKHNQSNIVEIQIQIQTTALASSLSEKAITKNNIINNIHNTKIHGQNLLSSLFVKL